MTKSVAMKPLPLWKSIFCYITLGLLCGWYYFLLILYPVLIFMAYKGSWIAGTIFSAFIALTFAPLKHKVWNGFLYSWIWKVWWEYFDWTGDWSTLTEHRAAQLKVGKKPKYFFFEFPHGIFPMGQFLSAHAIRDITPDTMICGTAADIVFMFPVMRQVMAWIGTVPAKREQMKKVHQRGDYLTVIPGGIAEMYLMNNKNEGIFLKKRFGTVKAAIQDGADIVPVFFFGNTKIFNVVGNSSDSWVAKISRQLRASIVLFYGKFYLPIPFRHPIRMVTGRIVEVKQKDSPTEEDLKEVMDRVVAAVQELYDTKKPEWETRPLVIS